MIKRLVFKSPVIVLTALVAASMVACGPQSASPDRPTPVAKAVETRPGGWQAELERVQSAAKIEKSLTIYGSGGSSLRDGLNEAFGQKYGIGLEWVMGPIADLTERVLREQRAGIYAADIYLSGASTLLVAGKHTLEPIDPILFLPEVLDKNAWWGGDLIFINKEHIWVGALAFPQPPVLVNTQLVKPGEVKSYQDLLDPKWKGKIALYNPRTGAGLAWAYHVSEVIMSRHYLLDFAQQEPIILDNSRLQVEWVARGKNPIAVAPRTENANEFIQLGSPVELVSPVEGVHLTSSAGGLGLFKNAPHPNAAKLFLNWTLTREGGAVLSRVIGGQSARLDVPSDFIDSSFVRREGIKYFNTITEEHMAKKDEFAATAMQIFGSLMK